MERSGRKHSMQKTAKGKNVFERRKQSFGIYGAGTSNVTKGEVRREAT